MGGPNFWKLPLVVYRGLMMDLALQGLEVLFRVHYSGFRSLGVQGSRLQSSTSQMRRHNLSGTSVVHSVQVVRNYYLESQVVNSWEPFNNDNAPWEILVESILELLLKDSELYTQTYGDLVEIPSQQPHLELSSTS